MLPALISCATSGHKPMTRERQAAVRSVSIAKSVALPEHPLVFGPSTNAGGMLFGPLALAGAASADNPDSQALEKAFADHGIDLGDMVRQEFIARLAQIRMFPEIDAAQGDAVFELSVESYGLGPAGFTPMSPINHPLNPTLRIAAKLTSRDGEILWQDSAYLASMSDWIQGRMFEEILADPEQTRQSFAKAAEIVCRDLLKDFGVHPGAVN